MRVAAALLVMACGCSTAPAEPTDAATVDTAGECPATCVSEPGPQGEPGAKGDPGANGEQGPAGPAGVDGAGITLENVTVPCATTFIDADAGWMNGRAFAEHAYPGLTAAELAGTVSVAIHPVAGLQSATGPGGPGVTTVIGHSGSNDEYMPVALYVGEGFVRVQCGIVTSGYLTPTVIKPWAESVTFYRWVLP